MANKNAIFVHERYDVSDSSDGSNPDGGHQAITHSFSDPFGITGSLAKCPGQLEGHAGAAQAVERIIVSRQARMDDCRGVG